MSLNLTKLTSEMINYTVKVREPEFPNTHVKIQAWQWIPVISALERKGQEGPRAC